MSQVREKEEQAKRLLQQAYHKLSLATHAAQIGVWELEPETKTLTGDNIFLRH